MIKKLNIALVVFFALMLALKGLKSALAHRPVATPAVAAAVAPEVSDLAPDVLYAEWEGFVSPNPITNRNGLLLDILREIFPQMRLVPIRGGMKTVVEMLRENPTAVLIGFGDHPAIMEFPRSQVPIGYSEVVVCTRRTNPWRYADLASLKKLRLGINEEFLDYPRVNAYYTENKEEAHRVKLYSRQNARNQQRDDFGNDRLDGFLATQGVFSNETDGTSALNAIQLRESAPIDRGEIFFRVSNTDPEKTAALIRAYEQGMERLRGRGILRRIYEYYGKTAAPSPDAKVSDASARP